jgi:hypothetical protein
VYELGCVWGVVERQGKGGDDDTGDFVLIGILEKRRCLFVLFMGIRWMVCTLGNRK